MIVNSGSAHWDGGLKEGRGKLSVKSGVLKDQPYGFKQRFEGVAGTNPEELIAAAHAACFSMAFSAQLENAGVTDVSIDTSAKVGMEVGADGPTVKSSMLTVHVTGTGDAAAIKAAAEAAKAGCPISKLLNCEIGMELAVG